VGSLVSPIDIYGRREEQTMTGILSGILFFLLSLALVHATTAIVPFVRHGWSFENPRRSTLCALLSLAVGPVLVLALIVTAGGPERVRRPASSASPPDPQHFAAPHDSFNSVLSQTIIAVIAFGPAALMMRLRKESWASAGVSRTNLGKSVVLGAVIGLITMSTVVAARGWGVLATLGAGHFWAFLRYGVVGFGEEFAFRGYLQTRMIAWLGRAPGWVMASLVMALAHVGQRVAALGMSPGAALASSVALIPISLLLGYLMIRTENIAAPGLMHTFADWVNTLA
jgi:membrane protease YdiL (CAAX protease family)